MSSFRLLVTVGSDHHPYERLVGWADTFAAANPDVEVTVQYGTATAPRHARGNAYLDHTDLARLMAESDAVVTQGGPTTIAECRRRGLRPIVAPRHSDLGEHVDDHQRLFAQFLQDLGKVVLVDAEAEFHAAVRRARTHPEAFRVDPEEDVAENASAVARFGEIVGALPLPRTRSRQRRHGGRS